jgi:class 3 adenylate cyclase
VILVVAIRGAKTTWFAAAPIALGAVQERRERITRDQLGDEPEALLVVDRNRRVIAHADPERALTLPITPAHGVLGTLTDGAIGDAELLVYGEYGAHVSAARSLGRTRWIVVAQRPHAVVFASLARTRRTVIAGTAVALAIALTLALVAAARLARPVQTLVRYSDDLARRRWDRRVELHTGDELEELAVALSGAAGQLQESEDRIARERKLRADLGRYLPAQLVEQLANGDQSLRLGGEERVMTVLFADVASFTSLVERRAPEEVTTILNQLFTVLTEIVFRHGGTVDKFIGDCVMAFWGAPARTDDHAARAVAAAEAMLRWLELANEAWQASYGVTVHLSIGVHSGAAVVGNFGSEWRMEYTCVGDTVNIAARLEALARPQQILVSGATREAAPAAEYVPVGAYEVPGRRHPVDLHEVMWR